MGWKGKGLGRDEQGILNPLIAKKTDANSAVIVESSITHELLEQQRQQAMMMDVDPTANYLPAKVSKAIVFENLVPIQEVDEMLRDEVKIECERYGAVSLCLVHTVPLEELVRVFAEYKELDCAKNAYLDFRLRDFAGKMI